MQSILTRGYFVNVAEQTVILDQYGTDPSYKVGLKVEERIVTADEDATLYDNAGSTNFSNWVQIGLRLH